MSSSSRTQARERAQEAAQQRAEEAKSEFARVAFDALEDYFPEEARERRQRDVLPAFLAGLAAGFVLRSLLSRVTRSR